MNSRYENDTPNNTFLDDLIQSNAQALEVREEIPYQPVVYAIPEEWRMAEMKLLEEAVRFQPELYRLIQQLATTGQLQQMLNSQLAQLQKVSDRTMSEVNGSLRQDGKTREQSFTAASKLLSDSLSEWKEMLERTEAKITGFMIGAAATSVALAVLVCIVFRLSLG